MGPMMSSKYCVICEAQKGEKIGVEVLFLVDRSLEKKLFWTSDRPGVIKRFKTEEAALQAVKKLKFNSPEVVLENDALLLMEEQEERLKFNASCLFDMVEESGNMPQDFDNIC